MKKFALWSGLERLPADALKETGGPLTKKERMWADRFLTTKHQKKASGKGKAA